jgi:hypothetical protein
MGLEALDLILVLLLASINNLIFGGSFLAVWLVFILPVLLALILFLAKRNKPDGFLVHAIKFSITPGSFSAGTIPKNNEKMKRTFLVD